MAFLGFESWKIDAGPMRTNCRAAKAVAKDLGGDPNGGIALIADIQTRNIYGDQTAKMKLRYGILISTLHEWNYWRTPDTLAHIYDERVGHGYGAYRLAFMPEIFANHGNFEFAFGAGIGFGFSKHFVDDNVGLNDNEDVFEGFIRPQVSIAYGEKGKAELTIGYHQPFLGTYGEYWYYDTNWESVHYSYSPSELAGVFVKLGYVFAARH